MFRDFTNTKFKSVCLMKINICTQVMQERRVESRSIGGVLSEFYLNVKLSVQLLTITWKTSKESIIMVLILKGWKIFQMLVSIFQMFIKLTKIFLNKETNTRKLLFPYFCFFYSSLCSEIIPTKSSNLSPWWKSIFVLKLCRKEGWKDKVLAVCAANSI